MGNAFVAVADDVHAIHYNPAGLALLRRPEVGTSYSRHMLGLTDGSQLSSAWVGYAQPLKDGKWGSAGAAWEQFALNTSLYQEHAFYLSHGRRLAQGPWKGELFGGANLKYLRRSFGSPDEAANAMRGFAATGRPDPVLAGGRSMGAPDLDLGFLYRLGQRYSAGLAILHVAEPDVSFGGGGDRVARAVRVGLGYRSLLSNIGTEFELRRGPDGGMDNIMTAAAERWLPRLLVGDFGVRGGLSIGSRDYKQATLGLSYRTGRFGVDYAFALPLQGATDDGSHRLGFSLRFGKRDEPDESIVMILDAMKQLKKGIVPELRPAAAPVTGTTPAQKAVLEELVTMANSLTAQARYRDAMDRVGQALAIAPNDPTLMKSYARLSWVAQAIRELPEHASDPAQHSLHEGILAYLAGSDAQAIEMTARALSLKPDHQGLQAFLAQLELATGLKRPPLAFQDKRYRLEQLNTEAVTALKEGRYEQVVGLSKQVLAEEPADLAAWENLGTAAFALGDYSGSLEAWQKAADLEPSPAKKSALTAYIKSIKKLIEQKRAEAAAAAAASKAPARPSASPAEIHRIYRQGLDYYSTGQLERAKGAFEQVLALDPAYTPAAKALRRVKEELSERQP